MKMAILMGTAAAVALGASAASAQSMFDPSTYLAGQFYVGADGGYHFPQTFKTRSTGINAAGVPNRFDFGTDSGDNWMAAGKVGYADPSGLRLEFEYAFRNGDLDSVHGQASDASPRGLCPPARRSAPASTAAS